MYWPEPPKNSFISKRCRSRACYPQSPRASPVGETAVSSQPRLLQGNLLGRRPRQRARAAPTSPWGKQEGACSQKSQQGNARRAEPQLAEARCLQRVSQGGSCRQ